MEWLILFAIVFAIFISGVYFVCDEYKLFKQFWCLVGLCIAFTYCVFITSMFFN